VLAERTHRSAGSDADRHLILLVVDQLAGWRTAVADRLGPELLDQLDRILIDGPKLGVVVAGGLDRPGALPLGVSGAVGDRLVFRLADGADALAAGVSPAAVKGLPAGRAVLARSGLELQVRHVDDLPGEVATLAARTTSGGPGAPAIRTLPRQVHVTDLPRVGPMNRPWSLPIGVGGDCLEPVTLPLHAGDHLLVTGPARSGKSSALALLATQIRRACPSARIVGLAPRRSGLHTGGPLDEVVATPEDLPAPGVAPHSPLIVVVDDAELLEDPGQVLAGLLSGAPDAHVIAAGRSDALRMAYGHWTQLVRRQRRGLVLRPQDDLDTDVLGVVLPRRPFVRSAVGRGYLVADGAQVLVQLATCGPRITDEHETADSVRDD
jgi:S-DNA-T family DNA segregation ATPase FtsK/SpoIIIE